MTERAPEAVGTDATIVGIKKICDHQGWQLIGIFMIRRQTQFTYQSIKEKFNES
jgi:hypothetical protein